MTYGQGMSAELVAMSTIAAADGLGMPVSTTHVLNSAVAGTMVANKSGLNFATVKPLFRHGSLPCQQQSVYPVVYTGCSYSLLVKLLF